MAHIPKCRVSRVRAESRMRMPLEFPLHLWCSQQVGIMFSSSLSLFPWLPANPELRSSEFRDQRSSLFSPYPIFQLHIHPHSSIFKNFQDFPGGTVVKNLPDNAGDTGSIPSPRRSHMPRSNYARAPQLLSLCSRASEPQLLSPRATTTEAQVPRAHAPQQEKPPQWEACSPQRTVAPTRCN